MQFSYQAVGKSGRIVKGRVSAATVDELQQQVSTQGMALVDYRRERLGELLSNVSRSGLLPRSVLIDLFGYLKGLTSMGMDVVTAFRVLSESLDDKRARNALEQIRDSISQGSGLADAMEKTSVFPSMVLGNVRAAEVSGSLEKVCGALEEHYRQEHELAQQMYKAALYPLISIIVLFFIGVGLLTFVVPQLKDVFPPDPPWPTAVLVWLSDSAMNAWWLPPVLAVAAVVGWARLSERHKARVWEVLYRVWVIGPTLKNLALCNLFANLGMILSAGVPITTALQMVIPTVSSRAIRSRIELVHENITRGGMFSDVFKDPFFPTVVGAALYQGETTGRLDTYLQRVSGFLRDRARARLHTLATLMEPALLLVGGAMLLFLAVSIFLPIYGQMQNVSASGMTP